MQLKFPFLMNLYEFRENCMKKLICTASILLSLIALGCTKHEVETRSQIEVAPVEIKPIHITIDVNIRVDRALDDFFSDIDNTAKAIK
jgi:hypothetical protein